MATYTSVNNLIQTLLGTGTDITAVELQTVQQELLNYTRDQWLTGDIKEIDCNDAYIAANFETSGPTKGRGIVGGEREGWAICNGLNGTKNRTGLVSVAYGTIAPTIGSNAYPSMESSLSPGSPNYGGNKNAVLIAHKHDSVVFGPGASNKTLCNTSGTGTTQPAGTYHMNTTTQNNTAPANQTSTKGITSVGNIFNDDPNQTGLNANMQPYIVTLFIQKL